MCDSRDTWVLYAHQSVHVCQHNNNQPTSKIGKYLLGVLLFLLFGARKKFTDKKENQIFLNIRKFRVEQLQSHI